MLRLRVSTSHELRPLDESDLDELHLLIELNRARLAQWMGWAERQTREQTFDFIRRTRAQAARNDGFQMALVGAGRIVGVAGFHSVDWQNRATSIGYWMAASEQGRGTMTGAVRALVDHALGEWQLNRVEIRADIENLRSRAIPERLGFVYEGTLRQAYRVGDRYSDDAVYSMLAEDWPLAEP